MAFLGRSAITDAPRYEAALNRIAIQQAAHRQGRATGGYEGLPLPGGRWGTGEESGRVLQWVGGQVMLPL